MEAARQGGAGGRMQSRNHGTGCCGRVWLDSGSSMPCPQAPTSPGFCGGRSHAKNTLSRVVPTPDRVELHLASTLVFTLSWMNPFLPFVVTVDGSGKLKSVRVCVCQIYTLLLVSGETCRC